MGRLLQRHLWLHRSLLQRLLLHQLLLLKLLLQSCKLCCLLGLQLYERRLTGWRRAKTRRHLHHRLRASECAIRPRRLNDGGRHSRWHCLIHRRRLLRHRLVQWRLLERWCRRLCVAGGWCGWIDERRGVRHLKVARQVDRCGRHSPGRQPVGIQCPIVGHRLRIIWYRGFITGQLRVAFLRAFGLQALQRRNGGLRGNTLRHLRRFHARRRRRWPASRRAACGGFARP